MARLDDVVSSALTGEATNNYISFVNGSTQCVRTDVKQTWSVTYDTTNFKWVVKSELYVKGTKLASSSGGTMYTRNLGINIDGNHKEVGSEVFVQIDGMGSFSSNGVYVGNTKVSSTPTTYTKVLEYSVDIPCSEVGRRGTRLYTYYKRDGSNYLLTNYTYIYLTLPSFSGMRYKVDGDYYYVMPWIKVNGTWKRALQYIKVNGTWKPHNDTWQYTP